MIRGWTRINLKDFTPEKRREYFRIKMQEKRAREKAQGPDEYKQKPDTWKCHKCGTIKAFTKENYPEERRGSRWGLGKKCKTCQSRAQSARKYGITFEEYVKLVSGTCAICGKDNDIVLDHCHKTGNIREGLCNACNRGIGFLEDDPERLRAAAIYVEKHQLLA